MVSKKLAASRRRRKNGSEFYIDKAVKTESRDLAAIGARLTPELFSELRELFAEFENLGGRMDEAKKRIFYGRGAPAERESPRSPLDARQIRLLHSFLGQATEVSELFEALGNNLFKGQPLDLVNIIEEIGDAFWYKAICADELGFSFEETWRINLAKLKTRYGGVFSVRRASRRDTRRERDTMEEEKEKPSPRPTTAKR